MTQDFQCGDGAALTAFLYQDGDADERATLAAHLAVCAECSAELAALSETRQQLAAWAPPDAQLDCRLNDERMPVVSAPATAAWWSRPLPAWAQLAAAAVIFAAGAAVGNVSTGDPRTVAPPPAVVSSVPQGPELAQLDARLRRVEQAAARPQPIRLDDSARQTLAALTSELRASEQRQSRELAERMMISLQETQDLRDQVLRHVEAEEQLRFGTSTVARGTGD